MIIVGLSGYARSGKDLVAQELVERYGFTRMAFADPLKRLLLAVSPFVPSAEGVLRRVTEVVESTGWEEAKDDYPEVRRLLQELGMGVRGTFGDA